jgi:hypothetical protein
LVVTWTRESTIQSFLPPLILYCIEEAILLYRDESLLEIFSVIVWDCDKNPFIGIHFVSNDLLVIINVRFVRMKSSLIATKIS